MATAWTYTTLAQALVDWCVLPGQTGQGGFNPATTDPQTVANVNVSIQNAEDRIQKEIDLPTFSKVDTSLNLTAGSRNFTLPVDFMSMNSISLGVYDSVDNVTNFPPLLERDAGFIREAFPSNAQQYWEAPRYYSLLGGNNIYLGGTPDQNYSVTLDYDYSQPSIVTAGTTWIGSYAPAALFYCSLQELYTYTKGEQDMLTIIAQETANALSGLKLLGEGKQQTDTFFRPNTKVAT